ncbi:hypothetical protein E2I00_014958 [Balaenoptera physalus]|uniref:NudC domain-containing protein 1 n=1 Tax=Balaenoptera physalus TaxID=9770 RepID=A0A6A1Q3F5_BALPH|nr:hypothetical protein E2I00_014958 [Balaenoptera physalus]
MVIRVKRGPFNTNFINSHAMEVAANCSLRVKRPLLDPCFEGYKLSLEPLPCYQLELDAGLQCLLRWKNYEFNRKPREVFRLPTDLTAYDNCLCASIHFTSSTWVTLSDGTGRLYLIGTGERGNSASEKWEIMFNEELGSLFIIIHSISLLKAEEHLITTLLLRTEKEELDMEGSGFYVSLEWVTINKKNKDNKKYEITKHNILRGTSVPHHVAFVPDGNGLMIVSYKSFTFVQVGQDLEESKDEDMSEKIKEPLYYWQQTEDDLTVTIPLPEDCTKEDIQIQFLPDHVNVVLKGQRFLEGNLYSSMDHESSIWIIKESNSLEISLIKKNEGLDMPELVLEECDIFFEESSSLCRFDGMDPKERPCFCLRHDVDALLWQPHSSNQDDMWEHIAIFNALGYVQASKRDKNFFACAPNYSYAALCECLQRVFNYRQPTPMSTVLYNRKESRQEGQVAKQQVASLETSDPILGFQATNERLFVLTTKSLFLVKDTGNIFEIMSL